MKKILMLLIFIIVFTGCKRTYTDYYYHGRYAKKVSFDGILINSYEEKSYLKTISISGAKKIPSNIKIITSNKIDTIYCGDKYDTIFYVYEKGIRVNSDSFIVEFGKIKLENGEIIELPPIKFTKYISERKKNPILDALNQDTVERTFQGTIEEYREWKKRNK